MTQIRRSPAAPGRATSTTTIASTNRSAYRPQDGYAALTAEDRADLAVLEAAAQRGFRLATRCIRCGQWLVAPSSVRAHLGPVCRARAVAE